MRNFKIGKKQYKCVGGWDEITIDQAVDALLVIEEKIPAFLKTRYDLINVQDWGKLTKHEETIDDELIVKTLPAFYGLMIQKFSDLTDYILKRISYHDRSVFYEQYIEKFVLGLLFGPTDFDYKEIKRFDYQGVTYYLPKYKVVLDERIPMGESQTIEFTESSDLILNAKKLQGGQLSLSKNVVSILCRPENEDYDEQTCLDRATKFGSLPMSIVWEVFFYILKQANTYGDYIQICLRTGALKQTRRLKEAGSMNSVGIFT